MLIMKRHLPLLLVASALALAGCCSTCLQHDAARWEYSRVYTLDAVNRATTNGWQLAEYSAFSTAPNNHDEIYILKRPKK